MTCYINMSPPLYVTSLYVTWLHHSMSHVAYNIGDITHIMDIIDPVMSPMLYATWLIHLHHMWQNSFTYILRDMTHWYVYYNVFISTRICIRVIWRVHPQTPDGMTLWYVWHDSLICVTWLFDMCDMTHSPTSCVKWLYSAGFVDEH